ncbi:hypothetical protein [Novosphingobium chloroacetimidivorans]|uniref:hypothetical protein n=1 Tax=Novosphingobium chloroacetimidivorans TaxID=1428314 RepID=UPI001C88994C|nr:hypothetical protein [Novosphingobium chloroacetimidivorans]
MGQGPGYTQGCALGRTRACLALCALAFVMTLPALCGVWGMVGDAAVHLRWQAQFAPLVWRGEPFPRWLPTMNGAMGSPSFFYYPPLLQWGGALFLPILPDPTQAPQRLVLSVWLIASLGAVGCFGWLRAHRLEARLAALGAAVFVLWPYRAFFDFYQRAALAELAGISLMPWLLMFATWLRDRRRGGFAGYALSVGTILYCHVPSALIGLLLSSAWLAIAAWPRDARLLARGVGASLVGLMIGAPCVATALGLLGLLHTPEFSERNNPLNWLLFSGRPWVDPAMYQMTIVLVLLGTGLGVLLYVPVARATASKHRREAAILLGACILVAVLNTEASRWFWRLQTPLSRIQFPFRLFGVQTIVLAGLVAIAATEIAKRKPRSAWLLWGLIPALLLVDLGLVGVQALRQASKDLPGIAEILAEPGDSSEYVLGPYLGLPGPIDGAILRGAGEVRSYRLGYRNVRMIVDARSPVVVALHQFSFTGWSCRTDGGPWIEPAHSPRPSAMATCTVPEGRHRVEARLEATGLERAAWLAAMAGLVLVIAGLVLGRRHGARHRWDRATLA